MNYQLAKFQFCRLSLFFMNLSIKFANDDDIMTSFHVVWN